MNAKYHPFTHACIETLIILVPLALMIALVALVLLTTPAATILLPMP